MQFPFVEYEIVNLPTPNDGVFTLKSNLPRPAIVHAEFYGDINGSRFDCYIEDNFDTAGEALTFGRFGIASTDNMSNYARAGSTLKVNVSDRTTGQTSLRCHIFYLPESV